METKKWYQYWGYWLLILLAILTLFGVLGNWFDWSSYFGGAFLVWVAIPFLIVAFAVGTIQRIKKNKQKQ